jgi:hypothetical protein
MNPKEMDNFPCTTYFENFTEDAKIGTGKFYTGCDSVGNN